MSPRQASSALVSDIRLPPIGAITNQAIYLINSLEKISSPAYPASTIRLRNVFLAFVHHVRDELEKLHDPENPLLPKNEEEALHKVMNLAVVIRKLFALKRYLDASISERTPPEIQAALHQLARFVLPHRREQPLILVRPQWHYNLSYVAIDQEFEDILSSALIATDSGLDIAQQFQRIYSSWRQRHVSRIQSGQAFNDEPLDKCYPRQMGILSFAALDTADTLLMPLLAHELGHFIDFTNSPHPLHKADEIHLTSEVLHRFDVDPLARRMSQVRLAASKTYLRNLWAVCVREILADFLALRMMGLSYFVALAEFLKTIREEADDLISKSGYPSIYLRLWLLLQEMKKDTGNGCVYGFLQQHTIDYAGRHEAEVSTGILKYLSEWEIELDRVGIAAKLEAKGHPPGEVYFAEQAVAESIPALAKIARSKVSNRRRAVLSTDFFTRVLLLQKRQIPALDQEVAGSFSEICSAAWTYQTVYGDPNERDLISLEARESEYSETCNLVRRAISNIPA